VENSSFLIAYKSKLINVLIFLLLLRQKNDSKWI